MRNSEFDGIYSPKTMEYILSNRPYSPPHTEIDTTGIVTGSMPIKTYSRKRNVITRDEFQNRRVKHVVPKPPDTRSPEEKVAARTLAGNKKSLANWMARVELRFFGSPVDMHPHEAIMFALRVTAGEVAYCDAQIERLSEDETYERPVRTIYSLMPDGHGEYIQERRDAEILSRWASLRASAIDRMARYAKMAIEVGVSELEVKLAESESKIIASFFEACMDDLELTSEQREQVGVSMRKHIHLVTGLQ